MKAAILALIVGALLNTGSVNGRAWSLGSVAAIVIKIGRASCRERVWLKV